MTDYLEESCSIQRQCNSQHSCSKIIQQLRYENTLKERAIITASRLIQQLREQKNKLDQFYQQELRLRDRQLEKMANKLAEFLDKPSNINVRESNYFKTKLMQKQTNIQGYQHKKSGQKLKLQARFKNFLNLSYQDSCHQYPSKNASIRTFEMKDSYYELAHNKQRLSNQYSSLRPNSINKNGQRINQTTKKSTIANKRINSTAQEKLVNDMANEITLMKKRLDEKDEQIMYMMKYNNQIEQNYNSYQKNYRQSNNLKQNLPTRSFSRKIF